MSFLINLYHWKISFTKKIKSPINPSVKSGLRKYIFQIRRRLIVFENVSIIKKFDNVVHALARPMLVLSLKW